MLIGGFAWIWSNNYPKCGLTRNSFLTDLSDLGSSATFLQGTLLYELQLLIKKGIVNPGVSHQYTHDNDSTVFPVLSEPWPMVNQRGRCNISVFKHSSCVYKCAAVKELHCTHRLHKADKIRSDFKTSRAVQLQCVITACFPTGEGPAAHLCAIVLSYFTSTLCLCSCPVHTHTHTRQAVLIWDLNVSNVTLRWHTVGARRGRGRLWSRAVNAYPPFEC